jgi:hypothetical protein
MTIPTANTVTVGRPSSLSEVRRCTERVAMTKAMTVSSPATNQKSRRVSSSLSGD